MDTGEEDPVVAEYDVFITPEMEQQLYILQYVNRPPNDPLTQATGAKPDWLRIKPKSGFVEVEVPLNIRENYNRPMGVQWGEALRKTKQFGQKAYGIASGFQRSMPRPTRAPGAGADGQPAPAVTADDDNYEDYIINFEDANEKGHVFNTQTYGGQIQQDDGRGPTYMIGTFRKSR
jgi:DNA-directed RNA polymerase-3 subunit RPC5